MSYNFSTSSWQTQLSPLQATLASPVTIGTNLVFSQTGLTGVRTFTLPDLSDVLLSLTNTATPTNKTIDAKTNPLLGVWQSPIYGRYGDAQPLGGAASAAGTVALTGALAAHTLYATNVTYATAYDTSEGLTATQVTTAVSGQGTGILSPTGATGICRTIFAGRLRTRFKVSTVASGQFYFGLTSNSTLPLTVTPLGAGDSGIIIGWRSTDTNFQIFTNNAGGAETVTQVAGPIATDSAWHTLEINWPAGGTPVNCIVDGTSAAISTALPLTTTPLFFNQASVTSTTSAITQSIHGTTVEFAK